MEDVKSKLKGTTLRVYWHLLQSGKPTTVRRVQRKLGLSSPSVASYHLEKLMTLEIVKKNAMGDYELRKTVSLDVMSSFVKISQLMIPRYVFYTIFFITLLIVFVVRYSHALSIQGVFALVFGGSGFVIMVYETWRQWRLKPI
ncbi:MAG: hypothetical protein JSV05_01895 [Candidatus Bathyarchaeota archaeon]|nr:MAG: hypothetical protein JSV05_01895 [Candidatus Bathyarchaeota archaeon]